MNDYKELIEMLRSMSKAIIREDAKLVDIPEENIWDADANAINDAADAIEQLVKERDAAVRDLRWEWEWRGVNEGFVNTICGIPIDEAMKILSIYKYAKGREIGPAFAEGFAEGYNAAVDEMNKKLKESLDASFKSMYGVKEAE